MSSIPSPSLSEDFRPKIWSGHLDKLLLQIWDQKSGIRRLDLEEDKWPLILSGLDRDFNMFKSQIGPKVFIKLHEQFEEHYRSFDFLWFYQRLRQLGKEPEEVANLLQNYNLRALEQFNLRCARCLENARPYRILLDRRIDGARCGGCGTIDKIVRLREMKARWIDAFPSLEEAESERDRQIAELMGPAKKVNASMVDFQRRYNRLARDAGVESFLYEDTLYPDIGNMSMSDEEEEREEQEEEEEDEEEEEEDEGDEEGDKEDD